MRLNAPKRWFRVVTWDLNISVLSSYKINADRLHGAASSIEVLMDVQSGPSMRPDPIQPCNNEEFETDAKLVKWQPELILTGL